MQSGIDCAGHAHLAVVAIDIRAVTAFLTAGGTEFVLRAAGIASRTMQSLAFDAIPAYPAFVAGLAYIIEAISAVRAMGSVGHSTFHTHTARVTPVFDRKAARAAVRAMVTCVSGAFYTDGITQFIGAGLALIDTFVASAALITPVSGLKVTCFAVRTVVPRIRGTFHADGRAQFIRASVTLLSTFVASAALVAPVSGLKVTCTANRAMLSFIGSTVVMHLAGIAPIFTFIAQIAVGASVVIAAVDQIALVAVRAGTFAI